MLLWCDLVVVYNNSRTKDCPPNNHYTAMSEFFIKRGEKVQGPLNLTTVKRLADAGKLRESDLIARSKSGVFTEITHYFKLSQTQGHSGADSGMPAAGVAPPPPPVAEWHVSVNGQTQTTCTMDQLVMAIRSGEVGKGTMVWTAALGDWTVAGQVPQLAGYFQTAAPPTPPPVPETNIQQSAICDPNNAAALTTPSVQGIQATGEKQIGSAKNDRSKEQPSPIGVRDDSHDIQPKNPKRSFMERCIRPIKNWYQSPLTIKKCAIGSFALLLPSIVLVIAFEGLLNRNYISNPENFIGTWEEYYIDDFGVTQKSPLTFYLRTNGTAECKHKSDTGKSTLGTWYHRYRPWARGAGLVRSRRLAIVGQTNAGNVSSHFLEIASVEKDSIKFKSGEGNNISPLWTDYANAERTWIRISKDADQIQNISSEDTTQNQNESSIQTEGRESDTDSAISIVFKSVIRTQLKNPDSASFTGMEIKRVNKFPDFFPFEETSGFAAACTVRATNSFGGVVPENYIGFFTENANVIVVQSMEEFVERISISHMGDFMSWSRETF